MSVLQACDFETFRAMWSLGLLPTAGLAMAGVKALEAGYDVEASRILAGLEDSELGEKGGELFETILEQLPPVPLEEAAMTYARAIARGILDGSIDAANGARAIWLASQKVNEDHEFHTLDGFIYAASEYEDRPNDRAFFRNAIEEEARTLIVRLTK